MAELFTVFSENNLEWKQALMGVDSYDFYHLPGYHTLHEKQEDGKGMLLAYREGDKFIALPLLIRKTSQIPGLETFASYRDATSVYGYPGPLVSQSAASSPAFITQFYQAITQFFVQQGVVSVFSRLHPILQNQRWLHGLGELVPLGHTVGIDLSLPPEHQWAQYRSNHRRNIRQLRRANAHVVHDQYLQHLETFVSLYIETMRRVHASNQYFFTLEYFKKLFAINSSASFHLFLCQIDNEIVSGGIFSNCNGIIQYHLGGTATTWLKKAPMKLVFDQVRLWANEIGAHWFHLGGGVGAAEDSLFRFKAGFSPIRFPFFVWKWIVQPDIYRQMIAARRAWYRSQGQSFSENAFFPVYRQ